VSGFINEIVLSKSKSKKSKGNAFQFDPPSVVLKNHSFYYSRKAQVANRIMLMSDLR